MTKKKSFLPTEKNIEDFDLLKNLLKAQKTEFSLLSKKKNNEHLNKMKIKIVNRVLEPLKEIFQKEEFYKFLDTLKEEDLPTNSDVVLIISQYETAISKFYGKYFLKDEYQYGEFMQEKYRWMTQEFPPDYYAKN